MNFDELTDADIDLLISQPKHVTNPNAQWRDKPGHRQRNFKVESQDYSFELYLRQNTADNTDFSCGLLVYKPDGQPLTLLRYNGASHVHEPAHYECHIHRATEQAIIAGGKPEREIEVTNRYRTLDGAVYCLVEDAKIEGIEGLKPDERDLFEGQ